MNRDASSHRYTERNAERTAQRIETYQLLKALLQTWEEQPTDLQILEQDYIRELRARENAC